MDSYIINLSVIELDYDTHALQVDRGEKTYTLQYVSQTYGLSKPVLSYCFTYARTPPIENP